MAMIKQTNPFYNSKRWKTKRGNVLRRDKYLCRECKRYGRTKQADTVHHVHPLESYPEHKLDASNLISLCNNCHENMHDRFNGNELTDAGIKWKNKVAPHLSS